MGNDGEELEDVGGRVDGDYVGEDLDDDEECGGDDVAGCGGGLPAVYTAFASSVLQGQAPRDEGYTSSRWT